jgi:hypothetical protein
MQIHDFLLGVLYFTRSNTGIDTSNYCMNTKNTGVWGTKPGGTLSNHV